MTRGQLWIEVRYRLVLIGIAAIVLVAGWAATGGSIHFGMPPPYDPPTDPMYDMDLYWGNAELTTVGGTITGHGFVDCPNLVLIFNSGRGYLSVGPVPARGSVTFPPAEVHTLDGHPYSTTRSPRFYSVCEPSTSVI